MTIAELLILFASACFAVAGVTILIRLVFRRARGRPSSNVTISRSKVAADEHLTGPAPVRHRGSEAAASKFVRMVDRDTSE